MTQGADRRWVRPAVLHALWRGLLEAHRLRRGAGKYRIPPRCSSLRGRAASIPMNPGLALAGCSTEEIARVREAAGHMREVLTGFAAGCRRVFGRGGGGRAVRTLLANLMPLLVVSADPARRRVFVSPHMPGLPGRRARMFATSAARATRRLSCGSTSAAPLAGTNAAGTGRPAFGA